MDTGWKDEAGRTLGQLLEQMQPRLEQVVAVRMDNRLRRRLDPADVVQAAYVDVVRRFQEWTAGGTGMALFVWVRYLTVQKVAELYRRHLGTQKRDARREVRSAVAGASTVTMRQLAVDAQESPSKVAVRQEQHEALHHALDCLKPIDREIILLRHFEQLSNEECAQILTLSVAGAKVRHLRAARRLRERLERDLGPQWP